MKLITVRHLALLVGIVACMGLIRQNGAPATLLILCGSVSIFFAGLYLLISIFLRQRWTTQSFARGISFLDSLLNSCVIMAGPFPILIAYFAGYPAGRKYDEFAIVVCAAIASSILFTVWRGAECIRQR